MPNNDGGHVALIGFKHQIDKTIFEAMSNNDYVYFENIQDLNTNEYIMQVKYHEQIKYTPSKIKEPIIKLIHESIKYKDKDIVLYCYFKENVPTAEKLDILQLNNILSDKKDLFSEEDKQNFIDRFKIIVSEDIIKQFDEVIELIKKHTNILNNEELIVFYSVVFEYIIEKIVLEDPESRKISRAEILKIINNRRLLIFNSVFRTYKGEVEYFKFIKRKFFTFRNIDDFERFIIIDINEENTIEEIVNVIIILKKKFYIRNIKTIKSGAPYIFLNGINKEKLKAVKLKLDDYNINFRDGYKFLESPFNIKWIAEPSSIDNNIQIKIVNTTEELQQLINNNYCKLKKLYNLYMKKEYIGDSDIDIVNIKINNISDILEIL